MKNSQSSFRMVSALKSVWEALLRAIMNRSELQVWQTSDKEGCPHWNAYDPVSDRSISLSTEAEMRMWIEQNYYR